MEKFFKALLIPAKWILVIGSLVYATWFAVHSAGSINGTFMSVVSNLLILIVGSALLFSVPLLIIFKKVDMAKIAFFILAGYWLISTTLTMFGYAQTYTQLEGSGAAITGGIFAFITALCLVGVLALIVLEFVIKKPALRLFTFFVMFGVILFALLTGILLFAVHAKYDISENWAFTANLLVEYLLVPVIVCFGCLFFLGAPSTAKKGE